MAVKTKSERGPAGTLTVDDLTRAIKNSIDRTGMKEEEARAMAQHVLNFFGYSERIIDNVLEPEDRDAFYMLEDSGILTTERKETTLYDGREWRIHYWMFRKERIAELVEAQKAKEEAEKMGSIDDEPGVQPAEFERDPSVEGAGGRHAASMARGGLSFPGSDRIFNPDSVPDGGGGNWQPASLVLAVAPRISSERCSARTAEVPCPQGRRRRPALRRCTRRPEPTEARCLACHRRGTWGGASKSTARRPDFSCSSSAGSFHGFRSLGCWEACSCSSARSS